LGCNHRVTEENASQAKLGSQKEKSGNFKIDYCNRENVADTLSNEGNNKQRKNTMPDGNKRKRRQYSLGKLDKARQTWYALHRSIRFNRRFGLN